MSLSSKSLFIASAVVALLSRIKALGSNDLRNKLLLGSVGTGALALVLRLIYSRKSKLISDHAKIGYKLGAAAQGHQGDYDFVIIGGGTSGCALAARLTENPNIRVLVLESGGSGKALPFSRTPSGFGQLFFTSHVFNIRLEPQIHAKGKRNYFPRGKLLGGCSSINAQMAQYGAPGDFDEWAKISGDPSWSFSQFQKYFRKFENYKADKRYPLVDLSTKGTTGPVRIGYNNNVSQASKAFITACTKIGIPFTPDFNGPAGTLGASRIMTYVDDKAERVSSESAYLTESVLARPNLKVAIRAHVTRIFLESGVSEVRATGVEFQSFKGGPRYRVNARREVILSAGAIHSPHILMLSGIGRSAHLAEHGIPVIHESDGVGTHLIDHPIVDIYFKDKYDSSVRHLAPRNLKEQGKLMLSLMRYLVFGTGDLATNFGESAAFCRTDDPVLFPPNENPPLLDSTSNSSGPDLELFSTPLAYKEHGQIHFDFHTLALHAYLVRPTSKGVVKLVSNSPWDDPSVNPNYCQTEEDLQKLVRGVKLCLRIAQTEPLSSFIDYSDPNPDLDHSLHLKTDKELEEVVKERVETVYHPMCTCRMAPLEEGGVVDSQLRVYGVKGLRICDASVFPSAISGHTAGACFAAAEKLADIIKAGF